MRDRLVYETETKEQTTGDFYTTEVSLEGAQGYAIIASTTVTEPDPETYNTGAQEIVTLGFEDFATTNQDDYFIVHTPDSNLYAIAIDKTVANEVVTFTFADIIDTNASDFFVVSSVSGDKYAVAIDTILSAQTAILTMPTLAAATAADYCTFSASDGTDYAFSLNKDLAEEEAQITYATGAASGNDDWLKITAQDGTVYGSAIDKSLTIQEETLTVLPAGSIGNNDFLVLSAKNGSSENTYAINLDKSLKPQIDVLTFLNRGSQENDNWVQIYNQAGSSFALALDKSSFQQIFAVTFPSYASCNDGDFCEFYETPGTPWAFSLDKVGVFEEDSVQFLSQALTLSADYLVLTTPTGTLYGAYADLTGSDAPPTGATWTAIPGGNTIAVNLSTAVTNDDVAAAFISALNSIAGFTSSFSLVNAGAGVMTVNYSVIGSPANSAQGFNATGLGVSSFTPSVIVAGVNQTVPTASQWTSIPDNNKVIVHITNDITAASVCNRVKTAVDLLVAGAWATTPASATLTFVNALFAATSDPVDYNADATGDATFTVNVTQVGVDRGQPSGPIWSALLGSQKQVIDLNALGLISASDISAQALIVLNTIPGFSASITVSNPYFDGTLVLTQNTAGSTTNPIPFDDAETGVGTIVATQTQDGGNTTYPSGPIWGGTFTQKKTIELYGIVSAIDTAAVITAGLATVPGLSGVLTVVDNLDGTISFTQAQAGAVTDAVSYASDDSAGDLTFIVNTQGADSGAPTGLLWTAIPSLQKIVSVIDIGMTSTQVCSQVATDLATIAGFTGKITVTDNLDGTLNLTQVVGGAVTNPTPYDDAETGSGSIGVSIITPGQDATVPTGGEWTAIPSPQKVVVDIRTSVTAIEVANAVYSAVIGISGVGAKITITGHGDGTISFVNLVKGACSDPSPNNYDDSTVGSITFEVTIAGGDQLIPTDADWLGVGEANRFIVDGTILTTGADVAFAVQNALLDLPGFTTQMEAGFSPGNPIVIVTQIALGNATNPVLSSYDGLGPCSITDEITVPGEYPIPPTGSAWLAVPAENKTYAACISSSTAEDIADQVVSALGSLTSFTSDFTLLDNHDGTITLTTVLPGATVAPQTFNADDSGAGTITYGVDQSGVTSDVNVEDSSIFVDGSHLATGLAVQFSASPPSPLLTGTTYYVIGLVIPGELQFASTYENALEGIFIPFSGEGSGNSTITITPSAVGITIGLQAKLTSGAWADIPDTTKTVTTETQSLFWNMPNEFYQYVRMRGTITGGILDMIYDLQTKGN
jgi:hypothetical protein